MKAEIAQHYARTEPMRFAAEVAYVARMARESEREEYLSRCLQHRGKAAAEPLIKAVYQRVKSERDAARSSRRS